MKETIQEGLTFYLTNSISPVFQVLTRTTKLDLQNPTTVTVAHDTTEAVEEAVNFLEKDSR
jgi:hypothetical protein